MKGALAITCMAVTFHSCGPPAYEGGFDSANPAAKMYAIEDAAGQGDRSALRHIIEQLDSDDPAVRSLAIATLTRLTGETFGYSDLDTRPARQEAIGRWVQAEQSGQLTIQPGAPNAQSPPSAQKPEANSNHG